MQIIAHHDVLLKGDFPNSHEWKTACEEVDAAVKATDWPHGSGTFTIYPQSGKKSGEGNGVKPIKIPCINKLVEFGWKAECLPQIKDCPIGEKTGDLDALKITPAGYIAFEWETGNISSSHRAINKLLLTLKLGGLIGGFLVVPSKKFAAFLTDRIGNIAELVPYFRLWDDTKAENAALRIVVVEHDAESHSVARIPKGTDGRASR